MPDRIYEAFLRRQLEEGLALAQGSDLLDLTPLDSAGPVPDRYIARFRCKGLVLDQAGTVSEGAEFVVGIWLPSDYLRHLEPLRVLTWLGPKEVFHPNINPPWICIGAITPGTSLTSLLYRLFDLISYRNWASHDGLNADACQWARNHPERFPLDHRPLKRRTLNLLADAPTTLEQP